MSARARILLALLFVALVRQLVLVVATPPYQGHDEVAHVGYLWTIIEYRRLPTLDDNLPVALSAWANYTLDWPALYTANHPPLYYLLARPLYERLGPPHTPDEFVAMLYALRLLAIPFYLATIGLAYALARTIFPRDDFLALTVPAAIAFGPQLGYEGAIFNNDILSIFSGALILFLLATVLRRGLTPARALAIGFALGLGLLGKATITIFFPLVAAVALWSCWPRPWRQLRAFAWWRTTMVTAAALVAPAVLLPGPWYLFLRRTYGDFSAFRSIQALQSSWNMPEGTFGQLLRSGTFHLERIHEYWGYFGWKYIPLGPGELRAVHAGLLLCGVGLVVGLVRSFRAEWAATGTERVPDDLAERRTQIGGVILVVAANLLMYGAMIYFGTMFQLTQARYIFPVATATALLAMLGLRALLPARLLRPAAALMIGALGAFNLIVLTRLVIPYAFL